jgi:hypothetical protein
MSPISAERLRTALERLAGETAPLNRPLPESALRLLDTGGSGLGYGQLNELLILLGFDRVTRGFFQYLVTGKTEYSPTATIASISALEEGVDRFRKTALLTHGNVKFAFKLLSRDTELLESVALRQSPADLADFHNRHEPVRPIDPIRGDQTYYLGYIIERQLEAKLKANPDDPKAQAEERVRSSIVDRAHQNHEAYLVSDHLDVYVATSMRERHEYAVVSRLTREIFSHPDIVDLRLRWFDPTQAYCKDRIDKGLAEALMLRRASCTIYFAQESDTLGKDSELASTLAQGKPVIAFVPEVDEHYTDRLLADLRVAYPAESEGSILLRQLRLFEPGAAWTDGIIRQWLERPETIDIGLAAARLHQKIADHYNSRAETLKEAHPLGIQVHLETGVANGVLVVRTVDQCAKLVRQIVTRTLEFNLEEKDGYTLLREKISNSVFRVMTGDTMLTNSFWNFYLEREE